MKRLPLFVTIILLGIFSSCGLIFLMAPNPAPWASAMNIECWELLVQGEAGGDDTPTTITESNGVIIIKGTLIVDGTNALGGQINSGQDDSVKGGLALYGPATGQHGPSLLLYTSAAHDDTVDFFKMAPSNDDLLLGPILNTDAFKMENDGTVDLTAGFKLAGTAVTSTATELNFLDGAIAGTAIVGKAVVLAADKDIDTLSIDKDGFKIGGSTVMTTAAEINLNDGAIAGTAVASKTVVLGANKDIDVLLMDNLVLGSATEPETKALIDLQDSTNSRIVIGGRTNIAIGYNHYADGVSSWKRLIDDNDASFIHQSIGGAIGFSINSDAGTTAGSAITWRDKMQISANSIQMMNNAGSPIVHVTSADDYTDIKALKIDTTAVTSTAGELNLTDNMWDSVSTSATDGANGTAAVQFTFVDDAGTSMTTPVAGFFYMSEVSTGLVSAPADTSLVTLTNGEVQNVDAAVHNGWRFITTAAGLLGMTITAADDDYYIVFMHPTGKLVISSAITLSGN